MREVAEELRADASFKRQIIESIEIAGVDQWAEASVAIKARIRVAPGAQGTVRREMLRRLKLRFDRDGIELPVQQVTLVTPRGQQVAKSAEGMHK
jgi:small conductance mechanosensitive channel